MTKKVPKREPNTIGLLSGKIKPSVAKLRLSMDRVWWNVDATK